MIGCACLTRTVSDRWPHDELIHASVHDGLRAGEHVLAAGASDPGAVPADGERVRVDVRAAPAANDSATRGELPVQFN